MPITKKIIRQQWQNGDPAWLKRDASGRFASNGSNKGSTNTTSKTHFTFSAADTLRKTMHDVKSEVKAYEPKTRHEMMTNKNTHAGLASNLKREADAAQAAYDKKWAKGSDYDRVLMAERRARLGRGDGMLEFTRKQEMAKIESLRERQAAEEAIVQKLENQILTYNPICAAAELTAEAMSTKYQEIKKAVSDAVATVAKTASEIGKGISGAASNAAAKVSETAANVAKAVSGAASDTADAVASTVRAGIRWITALFGR